MERVRQVLEVCPEEIVRAVMALPQWEAVSIEEIRLRNGVHPSYLRNDRETPLCSMHINVAHLQVVIDRASGSSVHSVQDMLKNGFVTISGGHRIGICGRGVYKDGELFSLRDISSLNLRVAREIRGIANSAVNFLWTHPRSTLILAPPGRGKTTLLRDWIRQLSDRFRWRICVVDERMEIAACIGARTQLLTGSFCDILSGVQKAQAIEMLLRSMNPQWIAVDEITAEKDVEAICQASYCGVRFLATAHASSVEELHERPIYQKMINGKVFSNLILIDSGRNLQMGVLSND